LRHNEHQLVERELEHELLRIDNHECIIQLPRPHWISAPLRSVRIAGRSPVSAYPPRLSFLTPALDQPAIRAFSSSWEFSLSFSWI
jgi:hypothetical protein